MYNCVNLCIFVLFFEIIAVFSRYCYFSRKPQSCLDLDIYQATNFQDPSRLRRLAELVWSNQFSNHFVAREPKHQPKRSKTLSGGRFQHTCWVTGIKFRGFWGHFSSFLANFWGLCALLSIIFWFFGARAAKRGPESKKYDFGIEKEPERLQNGVQKSFFFARKPKK